MPGFIGTILSRAGKEVSSLIGQSASLGWKSKTAIGAGRLALGNTAGRMATGAIGGAIYGGATSDSWSINNRMESMMYGAIGGAALGLGASAAWKGAKYADRLAMQAVKNPMGTARGIEGAAGFMAKAGYSAGKAGIAAGGIGARMAGGAMKFAVRHPYATAGTAAAVAYGGDIADFTNTQMYGQSVMEDNPYGDLSETQMNTALAQEQNATALMSQSQVAPMGGMRPARESLMSSTNGLVQGLHRSRHR